jgi:hypothetical protein
MRETQAFESSFNRSLGWFPESTVKDERACRGLHSFGLGDPETLLLDDVLPRAQVARPFKTRSPCHVIEKRGCEDASADEKNIEVFD